MPSRSPSQMPVGGAPPARKNQAGTSRLRRATELGRIKDRRVTEFHDSDNPHLRNYVGAALKLPCEARNSHERCHFSASSSPLARHPAHLPGRRRTPGRRPLNGAPEWDVSTQVTRRIAGWWLLRGSASSAGQRFYLSQGGRSTGAWLRLACT